MPQMCELHQDMKRDILTLSLREGDSHSDNIGDGYGHNGTNGVNPYLPLDA